MKHGALWPNYRELVRSLPERDKFEKADLLGPDFKLAGTGVTRPQP